MSEEPPKKQCRSCGRTRPASEIATLSTELPGLVTPLEWLHCRDSDTCVEYARRRVNQTSEEIQRRLAVLGEAVRAQRQAEVIELRPQVDRELKPAVCPCGSWWFQLIASRGLPGAINLSHTGRVTGWTGVPVCVECGTPAAIPALVSAP